MSSLVVLRLFSPVIIATATATQNSPTPPLPDLIQQAQTGDAAAQAELARAYEDGKGVAQSDELAAEWYRKSAEQGNAVAQNSLGVLYSRGLGVARDKDEAVRWYRKAAKQGLAEGAYNVAISYYNGEGVATDLDLAYAWMLVAESKGDAQAAEGLKRMGGELEGHLDRSRFKLARLYENGEELSQDAARAAALYTEVAKLDWHQSVYAGDAQYKLCQLYAAGSGVPEDFPRARFWCRKAAKNGAAPAASAYMALGRMAEQGIGTEKNLKEAADWYRDAGLAGISDGFLEMGRLKSQGGSHDNEKEAYFWLYTGQKIFSKIPAFTPAVEQAAVHLSHKEISEQQKKAATWLRMSPQEREMQKKIH